MSLKNAKIKTRKQFWIMLAAMLTDLVWSVWPGVIAFIVLGAWSSQDGALGKDFGFFLTVALSLAVNLAWSPVAWRVSGPLIKKLACRIGVIDKEE